MRHGTFHTPDNLKLTFCLEPHSRSKLPPLPPSASRLSAPRALKVSRIANHVARSLDLPAPPPGAAAAAEQPPAILLYCCDKPLPLEMSLLTARQYVWKQGGEMCLTYINL